MNIYTPYYNEAYKDIDPMKALKVYFIILAITGLIVSAILISGL